MNHRYRHMEQDDVQGIENCERRGTDRRRSPHVDRRTAQHEHRGSRVCQRRTTGNAVGHRLPDEREVGPDKTDNAECDRRQTVNMDAQISDKWYAHNSLLWGNAYDQLNRDAQMYVACRQKARGDEADAPAHALRCGDPPTRAGTRCTPRAARSLA